TARATRSVRTESDTLLVDSARSASAGWLAPALLTLVGAPLESLPLVRDPAAAGTELRIEHFHRRGEHAASCLIASALVLLVRPVSVRGGAPSQAAHQGGQGHYCRQGEESEDGAD